MNREFFPPRPDARPTIYAYADTNPQYEGLLKVGYTTKTAQERVAEQYPIIKPGKPPYRILVEEPAMRNDGSVFTDHEVHRYLRMTGVKNEAGEWFKCSVEQAKAAIIAARSAMSWLGRGDGRIHRRRTCSGVLVLLIGQILKLHYLPQNQRRNFFGRCSLRSWRRWFRRWRGPHEFGHPPRGRA